MLLAACKIHELAPGQIRQVPVPSGEPVALYNVGGVFYATSDTCTHGQSSLAEGTIEDGVVVCSWHSGSFEIATGTPVDYPCTIPIRTYPVTIEGDQVYIEIGA